ncbi:MAG: hypothetical protein V1778_01675 [bacterium]
MTILFPGKFCVSNTETSGARDGEHRIGHTRLDASGLISWFGAFTPKPCKVQVDGAFDVDASVDPVSARLIAKEVLRALDVQPGVPIEEVKQAIVRKEVVIL